MVSPTPPGRPGGTPDRPAVFFADAAEWRAWLALHHAGEDEIWMGLHKKHVADRGLEWADAVREALCFGWIDSKSERIDDDSRRQRWTPRRRGSTWSAVNIAAVEELRSQGRMTQAGLDAYARRRPERSGTYSYERPADELPAAYQQQLTADGRAAAFWAAATPGYRKVATHWVLGAKQPATRDRRMTTLVEDCAHGRLISSQRYGAEPRWVAKARTAAGLD
ncbi:YdeI/OmpD-associated family protein [Flexivirga meconopsidis]|uniref:YdeI/OmpD-associated family protein n=1 Tax=Flexivirga meconopsidis TaxID=2977121 RepID=UPI00223F57D1|nr:YdeI/OmpD-associated family protein [Flexivirga meconopsidis]